VSTAQGVALGSSSTAVGVAQGAGGYGVVHLGAAWVVAVSMVYLGCVLGFLLRLAWAVIRTRGLLREAEPVVLDAQSEEAWSACRRRFGVEDAVMLGSALVLGPAATGWVRPVLLMPPGLIDACSLEDLYAAWGHECAHMKRRDFQKNMLYEMAAVLIAFHPLTWLIRSRIAQTREMICDGMVTDGMEDRTLYARSLLRLASYVSGVSDQARVSNANAIGIFDANILERRVMTIYAKKKRIGSAVRYGLLVPGSLLMLSLAAVGSAAGLQVQAKTADGAGGSAAGDRAAAKGHVCTYVKTQPKLEFFPGTCTRKRGDAVHFYCEANHDRRLVQEQVACGVEGKLYMAQ
jgi:beta-lactamase regulating signal transducer with metallopeptidase domain